MLQNQPMKLNDPVPKRLKLMGAWAVKHMQSARVPLPLARAGEAKAGSSSVCRIFAWPSSGALSLDPMISSFWEPREGMQLLPYNKILIKN